MFKILTKWWVAWGETQDELAEMGVFILPWGSYVNSQMFEAYIKKLERGDQS